MIETGRNGYKMIYQGQDTMVARMTGWQDDETLQFANLTSEYRFHVRLADCDVNVIDMIIQNVISRR